jgi:predicted phosphate transport protein (TIGR00153 family)
MFWWKKTAIEERLDRYFEECDQCFQMFEKAVAILLEAGNGPAFESAVDRAHESESDADDLRREIELTLYSRALLPESRDDLLNLLESFDILLTAAETVLYDLQCQKTAIPEGLLPMLERLFETNLQAYYLLRKAVEALLRNPRFTLHAVKEVDAKESASDRLEREMLKWIYSADLEGSRKRELKELVRQIGRISDQAEHTADLVGIIALKRQI